MTPSVAVSVWSITDPLPAAAPVTLVDANTVQEYVVPVTLFGLVIETLEVCPEQIDCALAAAVGMGLTNTFTAYGVPVQPAAVGRMR